MGSNPTGPFNLNKMIKKILIRKDREENKFYYLKDINQDFHTTDGIITKKELKKTGKLKTKSGEYFAFNPSFADNYRKIKRGPQIIVPKDIGYIIAETGINRDSFVLDAGTGSGALACFIAGIAKKVVSYEIRDDFIKISKENKENLNLNNLTIKKGDVYENISEKNVDVIILDVTEPWRAIKNVQKSLKIGGFLVVYSPQVTQIQSFMNEITKKEGFIHLKTVELIERYWKIEEKIARPRSEGIGHTGFMCFFRKIE